VGKYRQKLIAGDKNENLIIYHCFEAGNDIARGRGFLSR
jgi:hypothetical protein